MRDARSDSVREPSGLSFILGGFRGGTTLLRKVLDSHTQVHSPAETWFLLPLLNLWEGRGEHPAYNPKQAAAALSGHLDQDGFLDCARAFAERFYARRTPPGCAWFIDKTPLYLQIAPVLPRLLPRARFIVLGRDPRGLVWSRHTWKHSDSTDATRLFGGAARDLARLASFATDFADRSIVVRYEDLCAEPESCARRLCEWLGIGFEPAMIDYGCHRHHEGYGDEKTHQHSRPHADSIDRWREGLTIDQQRALIEACEAAGPGSLAKLGYEDLLSERPSDSGDNAARGAAA